MANAAAIGVSALRRRRARTASTVAGCTQGAGITADIVPEGQGHTLRLLSEFGALTLALAHLDGDLFIARPANGAPARGPWTCTIRAMGDAVLLSSDRTKQLRFAKA